MDDPTYAMVGALTGGTEFLLARQGADGLWRDFATPAGEASHWPSGYIGSALPITCATTAALERTADTLEATQNADGGWGYNEDVPTDADSTAWVLLLLSRLGRQGTSCRRAASSLIGHQHIENGGVATYSEAGPIRRYMTLGRWVPFGGWCSPHAEVTAAASRALASCDRRAAAQAGWQFVRSRQRADGSWSSYWWTSPHYATLQAVELAWSMGDRDRARRALGWTLRSQDDDGGWSTPDAPDSAFVTALSLSVLLIMDPFGAAARRAVRRLVEWQRGDGSWPSHPMMRIPLPGDRDPDGTGRWRPVRFGSGIVVEDQHRTFTTATCVAALSRTVGGTADRAVPNGHS